MEDLVEGFFEIYFDDFVGKFDFDVEGMDEEVLVMFDCIVDMV